MQTHSNEETHGAAPVPPFVQVLYIGRFTSPELIVALRRAGVGVVAAFDSHRGAQLLQHFRPDAILCGPADADLVRSYAAPDIPVILAADEFSRRSDPVTTSRQGAVDGLALAERIRHEVAASHEAAQNVASCAREPETAACPHDATRGVAHLPG